MTRELFTLHSGTFLQEYPPRRWNFIPRRSPQGSVLAINENVRGKVSLPAGRLIQPVFHSTLGCKYASKLKILVCVFFKSPSPNQ